MTTMLEQGRGVPDVAALVRRAADGDHEAWERLVDQFARLIWSITMEFKLVESDAADVVQTTWLRLLEHIDRIQYPDRVGSWLAATARNECLRSLAARKRVVLGHDDTDLDHAAAGAPEIDERLLADERDQVVRDALSALPRRWQRLLEMLMADPPVPYTEISDQLGLPIGSIGPTRGRCLAQLRVLLQTPLVKCLDVDPRPAGLLDLRICRPDLSHQVGYKQQHGRRFPSGQFRWRGHGNVRAGHPSPLLCRGSVNDGRQKIVIDLRLAQQGNGSGRRPVAKNQAPGRRLRGQPLMYRMGVPPHILLELREPSRIADADPGIIGQQRSDRIELFSKPALYGQPIAVAGRGQQHSAAVQVELPCCTWAEAGLRQHGGQRGGRVIGVVPMAQGIPLPAAQDRAQRVVLQHQHTAGRQPIRPLGQSGPLVCGMHHAEAVQDDISLPVWIRRDQSLAGQQAQPGPAVRAAVLSNRTPSRQDPGRGHALYRVGGLGHQRGRLRAPRLLGHSWISQQLGQAA